VDTEQELDLGGPVPLKSNPMFDHQRLLNVQKKLCRFLK